MGQCFSILIASSRFPLEPQLATLTTPLDDVHGLAALLPTGPTLSLQNRPGEEAFQAIDQVYRQAKSDDVVFLYCSGYALLDFLGGVHLAMTDTRCHSLRTSALSLDRISNRIEASAVKQTALILDCSYRDWPMGPTLPPGVEVALARFARHGGVLSTATKFNLARERRDSVYGTLTASLIEALHRPEVSTLQDLHQHAQTAARESPSPEFYAASTNAISLAGLRGSVKPLKASAVPTYRPGRRIPADCQSNLAMAYSPDGSVLASAGSDGTISLWDAAAGVQTRSFQAHEGAVCALEFAPGGRVLASSGIDRKVLLWDVADGTCRYAFGGHSGAVLSLAFDNRTGRLASAGYDGEVRLWDVKTGQFQAQWRIGGSMIPAIAFHPEGRLLVVASGKGIHFWDTELGSETRKPMWHGDLVQSLCFNRDGIRLITGGRDGYVRLWNLPGGSCIQELNMNAGAVLKICNHPVLPVFAAVAVEGVVQLSPWDGNDAPYRCQLRHTCLNCAAFDADGARLAIAGIPGDIQIWQQVKQYPGDAFSSRREEK